MNFIKKMFSKKQPDTDVSAPGISDKQKATMKKEPWVGVLSATIKKKLI